MRKAKILIVEDEAIVAADIATTLARLGYGISGSTGRGEDALLLAREQRPDLVLMDIRLAGVMDGVEAADNIRSDLDLPVIFLTAHSDRATLERAKLSEPFGYLLKPFDELGLETHIEMALYKHEAQRRLRDANELLEQRVLERTKELRESEQALREVNETLEQRVLERTAELLSANTSLLNSRRAALNLMEDAVAARRQAENTTGELRKSEERYRLLFDNMLNGFAYCKMLFDEGDRPVDFIYVDVNESFTRLTGLTDVVGKKVTEVIPGVREAQPEIFDIYARVALTGRPESFEVDFTPLGLWLSISVYSPQHGEFAAVFDDVTERKLSEEALRHSQQREAVRRAELESLVQAVPALVWVAHDPDCRQMTGNRAVYDMLHLKTETNVSAQPEELPRHFEPFRGGMQIPPGELTIQKAARTGKPVLDEEMELRFDDGSSRWIFGGAVPLLEEDGSVRGAIGAFVDLTERKRAEEALRESEERVRRKLDSILVPEGDIGELDLEDIIDAPPLQALMDSFYELTGMPMGLIDVSGKVLVGVGWQDICTKYHRVNPETYRNCVESDSKLATGVPSGKFKLYKCKNNMWDVATPIIIGDRHFGNLFMGQFFFDDEQVDYEYFRGQAARYGFNEEGYLAALESVPRLNRDTLNTAMGFFMKLAEILSKLSYGNLMLARTLSERDFLMKSVHKSYQRLNLLAETASDLLASNSPQNVVDSLCRRVMAFLDCQMFFNFIVCQGRLRLNACGGIDEEEAKRIEWLEMGVAVCGCAAVNKCRIVAEDIQEGEDPRTALVKSYGIQAYACHPLLTHDTVVGTLSFGTTNRTSFTEEELSLMKAVADQVSIAIERKRAEEELRRAHDELEQRVATRTEELNTTISFLQEEVNEREKAEENALRLNRLYAVLSETNQAIVRAEDRDTVFREFCRIAVEDGGFLLAWVGLADEETGDVRAVAAAGAIAYLDEIHVSTRNEPNGTGPTGLSIREGSCYICNDFMAAEITRPWHDAASAHGIRASASFAMKTGGKVIGALTLYSSESYFFDEQQVGLLRQMSSDVSFALENLERDQRRRETEEALLQAQKMETVGRLAGGIAHDFNNLLMVMTGFAEQAQELAVDPAARDFLGHVLTAGARAKELTQKLLTFSRQQVMQKRRVDLGQVVEDILRLLSRVIGENIEIVTDIGAHPVTVLVDQGQIEQVVTNLVLNARDAMPEGGKLTLAVWKTAVAGSGRSAHLEPGEYAVIEVTDTGMGIAPSDLDHIFEPFFSTKDVGKGTGLGLSIAYSIISQHEGAITVDSRPGEGSTFRVYLPPVEAAPEALTVAHREPVPQGSHRLLLVEDDPIVRAFLHVVLQKGGYAIIEADDGEKALQMAADADIDLLVTDVLMPKMNGMDLHAALTLLRPAIKTILMSGYPSDIVQDRLPDGVTFLQKPISREEILRTVATVLSA